MDGTKPWGTHNSPAPVPKEWLLEMMRGGYRPSCLAGPKGTLNIFDPNIVHRASRPKPGRYRDAITFIFHPPHGSVTAGCEKASVAHVPMR